MNQYRLFCLLVPLVFLCVSVNAWATFTIHTRTAVDMTLTGFDGLKDFPIFQAKISDDNQQEITTPYRGLALLGFAGGQSYPVIIGEDPFVLQITDPGQPPPFIDSRENEFLYRSLTDSEAVANETFPFAKVLLQAKRLLESTYAINTPEQLTAKKEELTAFVSQNYQSLRHSDMVQRLMAQSFMMHEYVNYHREGEPATAIQQQYQQEVLDSVSGWLKALSPYIPASEIVNACVIFYYDRSMVTMAALIIDRFPAEAICPGEPGATSPLPHSLKVKDAHGKPHGTLADINGNKTIALVADDCPVSMTVAVAKARELARRKTANPLIVAPLQPLNSNHLAMAKMIRDEKILFIDDEKWFREQPATRPRLPLLVGEE